MAIHFNGIFGAADFARVIKYYRKMKGMSREELALISGAGKTAIYDIEHGKSTFQIDTLFKILGALDIKIAAIGEYKVEPDFD
ncbi:MAG: helix-turn-helix transcriptional regulator [Ignavibacteriaceae bacterium]|nr:helix-turn-helix transcriptional regulator [Ignavibacteriaceae bacterium]